MQQILLRGLFALTAIGLATSASAQSELPFPVELEAGRIPPVRLLRARHEDAGISVDGHVNEAIWQSVKPIGKFVVTEPDTLADTPYRTDLRAFYTDRGIYISFDMEQPADSIVERAAPRDAYEVNRDAVNVTLDTSGDGRYGYWMSMALGDSEMDGTILPERNYGRDWDGAWYGATQRTNEGWSAEFFIPWSQMAMPRQEGMRRIGIFASRKVAYLDERWGWPELANTQPRFMSALQPLELEAVDPRQQWSVFPYASGTFDRVVDDTRFKAGADLFWRPSTNFQLTATVNPDFGSVESDNAVVNLTADETFFPEKRLFFLEGQEIFSLSGREGDFDQPLRVVHTRRIGGSPREPVLPPGVDLPPREELKVADIIAASKATGQFGAFRYGLLAAVEDETDFTADDSQGYLQDGRDFGIVRILYEDSIGAAYRGLGWISTIVAHPEADAVVHGTDFHYLTTSGRWNINGQVIYSDHDEEGTGTGVLADVLYTPRQGLQHSLEMSLLDDKIDVNDLGFQRRNDVDDFRYSAEWTKSGLQRVRNFRFGPFVRYEVNGEGFRTNTAIAASGSVTFNNLASVGGFFAWLPTRYDDRNSFGNGTYQVQGRHAGDLNYRTDTSKPVSFFARLGYRGEHVYGRTLDTHLGVTWRPWHNFSMELKVKHGDKDGWLLHQEDQNFTAFKAKEWAPEFNLEFFPTSKQQLRLTMQWIGIRAKEDRFFVLPPDSHHLQEVPKPSVESDSFSISQLNFQVRYRWQIAPLSDLFVVYTKGDRHRTDLSGFGDMFRDNWNDPVGDQLVVKLRYRLGS